VAIIVTWYDVLLPALILLDPGETPIEKFALAGAWTFTVTVAMWASPPLCPVIVRV
jgi:hypothetical protein